MKTEHYIQSLVKYTTLSALAISSTAFAIERPTPAVQPEEKTATPTPLTIPAEQQKVAENAIPMPEVNAQKLAYLGVFGEPISDTLSAHLNLVEGLGIELEVVVGNSPAAKVGLQNHDIIISLAGKDISNQDDLRASIADKKPGDVVKLHYISKGKAITKMLTLGARPAHVDDILDDDQMPPHNRNQKPKAELGEPVLPEEFLNKFPKKDRAALMKLFKGNLEGLDLQEIQQGLGKLERFNLNLQPKGLNPKINQRLKINGVFNSRFKMIDKHGSVTLETSKDGKVIEILDTTGKLEYRGPYNNEADKMSVPDDLRDRVKNIDLDIRLGLPKVPK